MITDSVTLLAAALRIVNKRTRCLPVIYRREQPLRVRRRRESGRGVNLFVMVRRGDGDRRRDDPSRPSPR